MLVAYSFFSCVTWRQLRFKFPGTATLIENNLSHTINITKHYRMEMSSVDIIPDFWRGNYKDCML